MQEKISIFEQDIQDCQYQYMAGDRIMLFYAIQRCAQYGIPLPNWIRQELENGLAKYRKAEVAEFGEAFGITREPYWNQNAERKKSRLAFQVFRRVRELHEKEGRGITDALFNHVAKEFGSGLSSGTVRDYYYAVRKELNVSN